VKRTIDTIVIHCSAAPNGSKQTIEDIDAGHKARGFKRDRQATRNFNPQLPHIGYHFVITADGVLHTARGIEEVGAHVQGSNAKSIGVCMVGTDEFSHAQWLALQNCMVALANRISGKTITLLSVAATKQAFKDMGIAIKGHRDYSPDLNGDGVIDRTEWIKICPGFSVAEWLRGGMVALTKETKK